jgi:hypothetical protein
VRWIIENNRIAVPLEDGFEGVHGGAGAKIQNDPLIFQHRKQNDMRVQFNRKAINRLADGYGVFRIH